MLSDGILLVEPDSTDISDDHFSFLENQIKEKKSLMVLQKTNLLELKEDENKKKKELEQINKKIKDTLDEFNTESEELNKKITESEKILLTLKSDISTKVEEYNGILEKGNEEIKQNNDKLKSLNLQIEKKRNFLSGLT
jgi:tRNA U34 5-carboxymethylaminomethyl modifying GTPase MnmE/TrmE